MNIIGHSLGGWNGAHLSQILTEKGYNVDLLVTLDPVGTGAFGDRTKSPGFISDVYFKTPRPKCNYWINIYTKPDEHEKDDYVADSGGQWTPAKSKVDIFHTSKAHHGQAGIMFWESLKDTDISASDMLLYFIESYLKTK